MTPGVGWTLQLCRLVSWDDYLPLETCRSICVDCYCIICAMPTGCLSVLCASVLLCVYVFYVLTVTKSFVPCLLVS